MGVTADMLPFVDTACFEGAGFFTAVDLDECDGSGLTGREGFAMAFFGAGFFAATSFLAGRCGLTTALGRTALATAFFAGAAFPAAGFFTAFAGFLTGAFFDAGFFAAPALAVPGFFLAELAGLRFDVAIILSRCRSAVACYSPIARARQPLSMLRRAFVPAAIEEPGWPDCCLP
ncbi:MAG: hypothetical protein JSS42_12760 [Proteobacteria bacterium]|nr:hypothetical protein [Pseudomonadota bacterium]